MGQHRLNVSRFQILDQMKNGPVGACCLTLRQAQGEGGVGSGPLMLSLSKHEAVRRAGCLALRRAQDEGGMGCGSLMLSLSKHEATGRVVEISA
jgi:hypothetical protein